MPSGSPSGRVDRGGRHREQVSKLPFILGGVAIIVLFAGTIFVIVDRAAAVSNEPTITVQSEAPPLPTDHAQHAKIDMECSNFFDQADAQSYYLAQGGPEEDPDDLDLDNDGRACENFDYSTHIPPPLTEESK